MKRKPSLEEGRMNRTPDHPYRAGGRSPSAFLVLGFAAAALLPAAFPSPLAGQRARTQVEEGNRLYEEGRFEEAHQKYLEALLEDPESPLIRFNDGAALFRNQDFQRAMERFQEALESPDPALQSSAWYNLGNALYRQQQLEESLEAYKRALRTNPSDTDAKHNLERVLEQLQEQEQQQEGDDQQQEDQQQSDQNQQQEENQQGEDRQEQEQPESQGENQDQPPQPEEGDQEQPQPQQGGMTPEEAQRLLDAIQEDPGDVNRRQAPATGRRPRKKW